MATAARPSARSGEAPGDFFAGVDTGPVAWLAKLYELVVGVVRAWLVPVVDVEPVPAGVGLVTVMVTVVALPMSAWPRAMGWMVSRMVSVVQPVPLPAAWRASGTRLVVRLASRGESTGRVAGRSVRLAWAPAVWASMRSVS